ncbi:dharma [Antennarius striatus]|uniref:dharma n=1 Tax=Antennarius striatus TaxID=241820 RepID=UPI0035B15915
MNGGRISDFSIDRILSPQVGFKPPVEFPQEQNPHGPYRGFRVAPRNLGIPAPLPVLAPSLRLNREMGFGEEFYPYGSGFHNGHPNIYPIPGVYVYINTQEPTDCQHLPRFHGYHQAGPAAQPLPRQRARMRTVFIDSQTKKLEALFARTDYPTVEARAQVAMSTGLSEEVVRVWFKNRRARRKQKSNESKVKPASPARSARGDKSLFASFL